VHRQELVAQYRQLGARREQAVSIDHELGHERSIETAVTLRKWPGVSTGSYLPVP
jgi:hypothetical protein